MKEQILLDHGSGGKLSHELISKIFYKHFKNPILDQQSDSAVISNLKTDSLSFTTDSYVVKPVFFPGGNIGKLAVCGTVNDLSVSGAIPLYISAGFIIEEGLSVKELDEIVKSMATEAKKAGVQIVTGDTKVVEKGACDKIFINTSGIGLLKKENRKISTGELIQAGDKIIINGYLGDHGIAIACARNSINLDIPVKSDCACLNDLIQNASKISRGINFMRDITRGGLATVLCEISDNLNLSVEIEESKIHVRKNVQGVCEIMGFDPLYLANEGKVLLIVKSKEAEKVLNKLKLHPLGKKSEIIGEITNNSKNQVLLNTIIGGQRIVNMLTGAQLPRIC